MKKDNHDSLSRNSPPLFQYEDALESPLEKCISDSMVRNKDTGISGLGNTLFSLVPSGVPKVPQTISEEDDLQPISSPDSFSDFFKVLGQCSRSGCGACGMLMSPVKVLFLAVVELWHGGARVWEGYRLCVVGISMGPHDVGLCSRHTSFSCLQLLALNRKALEMGCPIPETEVRTTCGGEWKCGV